MTRSIDTEKYESMISHISNSFSSYIFRINYLDIEDLKQCAWVSLLEALEKYDVDSQADFDTWAWYKIQWKIKDEIRASIPRGYRRTNDKSSIPRHVQIENSYIDHRFVDRIESDILSRQIIGLLSGDEKDIVYKNVYLDIPKKDIAMSMGKNSSRITQISKKAMQKLRKKLR